MQNHCVSGLIKYIAWLKPMMEFDIQNYLIHMILIIEHLMQFLIGLFD